MDKNYYELLQVDRNASDEIIEKSYKLLVKKYHPDLEENPEKKLDLEEKLKLINNAYETLSNEELRHNYDNTIIEKTVSYEDYSKLYNENIELKNELDELNTHISDTTIRSQYSPEKHNINFSDAVKKAQNKAYNDAYAQDLRNRGYKIKYKKTFKDYLRGSLAILIVIILLLILIQLPFVQQFLNDNILIQTIFSIFKQ